MALPRIGLEEDDDLGIALSWLGFPLFLTFKNGVCSSSSSGRVGLCWGVEAMGFYGGGVWGAAARVRCSRCLPCLTGRLDRAGK